MKPKHKLVLIVLLAGCALRQAAAQDYVVSLRHWDMADGLAHRQVNGGIRDRAGFFWFTTAAGLTRFDGRDFVNYNTENSGLPFTNLEFIGQDASGMIWLLGNTGVNNICLFNPATGQAGRVRTTFTEKMSFLAALPDGSIFFGEGSKHKWWVYHPRSGLRQIRFAIPLPYEVRLFTNSNTVWLNNGQDFYEADMTGRVLRSWRLPVDANWYFPVFVPGSRGIFAFGSGNPQLWHMGVDDRKARLLTYVPPANGKVRDHLIHTTLDGIVFRQGRLYHPRNGLIKDFPGEGWDDLEGNTRLGLVTRPGEMWLGGSFGLYHITIRRSKFLRLLYDPRPVQDPHNAYRGLLMSRHALLAANEEGGIVSTEVRSAGSQRLIFSGLEHRDTRFTALLRRRNGGYLFTTHHHIYELDREGRNPKHIVATGTTPVWCIREWGRDSLLLGTEQGLAWFAVPSGIGVMLLTVPSFRTSKPL